jgi:hypothetical protein
MNKNSKAHMTIFMIIIWMNRIRIKVKNVKVKRIINKTEINLIIKKFLNINFLFIIWFSKSISNKMLRKIVK